MPIEYKLLADEWGCNADRYGDNPFTLCNKTLEVVFGIDIKYGDHLTLGVSIEEIEGWTGMLAKPAIDEDVLELVHPTIGTICITSSASRALCYFLWDAGRPHAEVEITPIWVSLRKDNQ